MDKRLKNMSKLLVEYAAGNFSNKIDLSPKLDEIDAITNGINMLGEELRAVTISRDYFNNIFNSVSDMIFLLDENGVIVDCNHSAAEQLGYEWRALISQSLTVIYKGATGALKTLIRLSKKTSPNTTHQGFLTGKNGFRIPVRISIKNIQDPQYIHRVLVTASDITYQVKAENLILRAIIDTQETERQRMAQDLHDSLTQQLSAIKFYIGTAVLQTGDKNLKNLLTKSNKSLTTAIAGMRNTCFNLMPKTLETFGLVRTIREFFTQFVIGKSPRLIITHKGPLEKLSLQLKIDLYRVIQEFISNAILHGNASVINITFSFVATNLIIRLKDNGVGFDPSISGKGMGIQNVKSRIRSHNGSLKIRSTNLKGTSYWISVPLSIGYGVEE